jgi:hypothetical protein
LEAGAPVENVRTAFPYGNENAIGCHASAALRTTDVAQRMVSHSKPTGDNQRLDLDKGLIIAPQRSQT